MAIRNVRAAGAVEYALLLFAVTIGGAAATKAVGHAVRNAGEEASVLLGAQGSASSPGGGGGGGAAKSTSSKGTDGVKSLPNTGAGPCQGDECKAADTNGDGVVTPEEWNDYCAKKQAEMEREAQALAQKNALAQQHHSLVQSIIGNVK